MTRNPDSPETCLSMYLSSRENEVRDTTLQTHEYRLNHFVEWCEQNNIDDVSTLDPLDIEQYKNWRRDDGDLANTSLKGQMDTLRVLLKFLARLGIVDDDTVESVPSISLTNSDRVSDAKVTTETARKILETLDRYHYATVRHVWFLLAWRTSARISSLRAVDLADYDSEERCITYREREGTKLKNGQNGERPVALSGETCSIIDDYIDHHRLTNTDKHGREPLFSSEQGRIHRNTMRRWCYTLTCPSFRGKECETVECNSQTSSKTAYQCDASVSPHAIRRGSITHFLREDMPEEMVSDRADVSRDVLEKHYDKRTGWDKMEQRRGYLDNI